MRLILFELSLTVFASAAVLLLFTAEFFSLGRNVLVLATRFLELDAIIFSLAAIV